MKIKSRNLLTAILALLCAVAVALGISFALPKNEIKSANADTVTQVAGANDVNVKFGTVKYSGTMDSENVSVVNYSTMLTTLNTGVDFTYSDGAGVGTARVSFTKNSNWKHRNVVAVPVILSVNVPAHTVYKVEYSVEIGRAHV